MDGGAGWGGVDLGAMGGLVGAEFYGAGDGGPVDEPVHFGEVERGGAAGAGAYGDAAGPGVDGQDGLALAFVVGGGAEGAGLADGVVGDALVGGEDLARLVTISPVVAASGRRRATRAA